MKKKLNLLTLIKIGVVPEWIVVVHEEKKIKSTNPN